jgi:peptidoglycan/xylan/chitin deacetylase (PgdA/CDA1 family)
MSVRSQMGAVRRKVLSSLYCRKASFASHEPIVSFTFDDFPRTAYSTGGAILEQFEARGTYYAAPGLMNTVNELGEQFNPDDLHALLEKEHELASHTFSHLSSRAVSSSAFLSDVEKGRRTLEEVVGFESGNFSYPYGHVTVNSKRVVAPTLASARGIYSGLNGSEFDLNLLRANALYGGMERARWAADLIGENVKEKSWLIFYTHDVRSAPSPFGCTPDLLEAAVLSAVQTGSRILTVREALAHAGVQCGTHFGTQRSMAKPANCGYIPADSGVLDRTMHFRDLAEVRKPEYPVSGRQLRSQRPILTGSTNEPTDSPRDAQAIAVHRDHR